MATDPTMVYENDQLIVKFDGGGLIIVRKQAEPNDNGSIALTAEEAKTFTGMFSMGLGAVQAYYLHQGAYQYTMPNPLFNPPIDTDGDEDNG